MNVMTPPSPQKSSFQSQFGNLFKDYGFFNGGRHEGSKRNVKFQSAMWHHFKHFQHKDFFLVAFLSQQLNYSVINI